MGMRKLHFWGPVWNLSYTSEFPIVQSYLNKIKHEQTDKAICVFTLKNKKKKHRPNRSSCEICVQWQSENTYY